LWRLLVNDPKVPFRHRPADGNMQRDMSRLRPLALALAALIALSGCELVQQPAPTWELADRPAATQRPSPTPAPDATPTPEQAAIAAFVRRATSGEMRYRATFRGEARATVSIVTTRGTVDVVGPDYNLVADFRFGGPGSKTRVEHRYVGGKAWLKAGSRWGKFTAFISEWSMSPFAAIIDETDVTYIGVVRARGETPERYRIEVPTGFYHPILIPAGNVYAEAIDRSSLELVIEANGTPVSGNAKITGRARVSGQLQQVIVESALTFSRVGSRSVVVRAP
jgi:hypothetical protein